MKNLKRVLILAFTCASALLYENIAIAKEKIVIVPLIQSSIGLSGKKISYPRWKQAELRLLKVDIPVGLRTPLHTHPAPMVIYVMQGKLKHVRGTSVNYFSQGDSFIESNNGSKHYVESIGKQNAKLIVGVSSVVGMPTTINKNK